MATWVTIATRQSITPAVAICNAFLGASLMGSAKSAFLLANSASTTATVAPAIVPGIVCASKFVVESPELPTFSLP